MFCDLINLQRSNFFIKKTTDYNPNYFSIVTVSDWSKFSSTKDVRPLRTTNSFNVIDRDFLKKSKIRVKLAKTAKF